MVEVEWLRRARHELRRIALVIAEERPGAALKLVHNLEAKVSHLTDRPRASAATISGDLCASLWKVPISSFTAPSPIRMKGRSSVSKSSASSMGGASSGGYSDPATGTRLTDRDGLKTHHIAK